MSLGLAVVSTSSKMTVFHGTHGPRWNGNWIFTSSNAYKDYGDVNKRWTYLPAVITHRLLHTTAGIMISTQLE
jgi:hypothetical protein